MIITTTRSALTVVAASLSLALFASPAMGAKHNDGTQGAVIAYNWDIPAGTASPSA